LLKSRDLKPPPIFASSLNSTPVFLLWNTEKNTAEKAIRPSAIDKVQISLYNRKNAILESV